VVFTDAVEYIKTVNLLETKIWLEYSGGLFERTRRLGTRPLLQTPLPFYRRDFLSSGGPCHVFCPLTLPSIYRHLRVESVPYGRAAKTSPSGRVTSRRRFAGALPI